VHQINRINRYFDDYLAWAGKGYKIASKQY
jgi:hypothetical protein